MIRPIWENPSAVATRPEFGRPLRTGMARRQIQRFQSPRPLRWQVESRRPTVDALPGGQNPRLNVRLIHRPHRFQGRRGIEQ